MADGSHFTTSGLFSLKDGIGGGGGGGGGGSGGDGGGAADIDICELFWFESFTTSIMSLSFLSFMISVVLTFENCFICKINKN